MDNAEIADTLEEMWEIMFQEMRINTFKDLQESGMIDKFMKAYTAVLDILEWKEGEQDG